MSLNCTFAGKKVLITGGGQGIGRQLVQRFHDDGATVYTIDKNPETLKKLREELPSVHAEEVDLTDWDATRKVVESFGIIDHLVNNAGIFRAQKVMDITKEAANLHFDINVGAVINVSQVVAKGLIEVGREGSILNISSIGARMGSPIGGTLYHATKAGLENLTKSMALELGPHKIRVNCILPGPVDAPMLQDASELADGSLMKMLFARMIIHRNATPNEITDLIMFLLSPLSSMIVGQGIVIDGGLLAN